MPLSSRVAAPAIPKPPGVMAYSYACPRCDLILNDGVAYTFCPACDARVDWVDLRLPVWCCATCDAMINEARAERPWCTDCRRPMNEIHTWERPPAPKHLAEGSRLSEKISSFFESAVGLAFFAALTLTPLSLALDPSWRWFVIAFMPVSVLIPLVLGGWILGSVAASFRELRELIGDRRTRIIHGIEHATVVVLLRRGFQVTHGQTDKGFFKVWLKSDRREGKRTPASGATEAVRRACLKAIERLRRERWSLAIHKKCGTTWMVLFFLSALAAISAVAIGLFMNLPPKVLLAVAGALVLALAAGARPLGYLVQRTMTIGVDFHRTTVRRIIRRIEDTGAVCYYVHLDVEP
ncbi:MAG TPA: DUF6391 domain-containing protein [Myxococcaceae bacterium]|nr:DUF6391 domain-containing protein [Myxococcaceae bacterium]